MSDASAAAMGRIGYLETVRGLAAVQVLLLHCIAAFAPTLVFALPASGALGGYIHLSPLYFLYDGYSAVYVFFTLSGFVLSRSFTRRLDRPFAAILARAVRLGVPAPAAVIVSAVILMAFGRPNAEAGALVQSDWFVQQWNPELSLAALLRDGIANALFLGYSGLSNVPMLTAWQQPIEKSFLAPLWTLSTEFYGSLLILGLCICARKSPRLWRVAMIVGAIYFIRSAYLCFVIGHAAAVLSRDDRSYASGLMGSLAAIGSGIALCVFADVWQPEWLRHLCEMSTSLLFPGQFPALQQKAGGAIVLLAGIVSLAPLREALSHPLLVRWSQLSFPIYLVHWPIVFGPIAALYLQLNGVVGSTTSALLAIVAGVVLSIAASTLFLPVDRFALELSRRLCRRRASDAPLRVGDAFTASVGVVAGQR